MIEYKQERVHFHKP